MLHRRDKTGGNRSADCEGDRECTDQQPRGADGNAKIARDVRSNAREGNALGPDGEIDHGESKPYERHGAVLKRTF